MNKSLVLGISLTIFLALGLGGDSLAQAGEPGRHPIAGRDAPGEFRRAPVAGDAASNSPSDVETTLAALDWAKLTFQSWRDNDWEIYLADGYGNNQTRLTYSANSDADPRINGGCTRLAFDSYRSGDWEIYTMNLDGSGLSRLTYIGAPDWNPAWSPDNTKIAFDSYRYGTSGVFSMNADGSNQMLLADVSWAYDAMPAWSPDGQKIAFVSDRNGSDNIYLMDNNGANQQLLITNQYSYHPTWSPNGTYLAFDSDNDLDGFQELWVYSFASNQGFLVYDPGYGYTDVWARSWSPDGRYLAFTLVYWILDGNKWYWTYAYQYAWDSLTETVIYLPSSGYDWHPGWASCDITKPVTSIQALPAESPSTFTVKWSGSDQGSGIRSYDIQLRAGLGGEWVDWSVNTALTSKEFTNGKGNETFYFRSRAIDNAGNREAWPAAPDAWTVIESSPPVTQVGSLPEYTNVKSSLLVSWSGSDPGRSGIMDYTVEVRQGLAGTWTGWLYNTTAKQFNFVGQAGVTYYFRVRGRDYAYNVESWPEGDGDTHTTFYDSWMGGTVTDNRGSPVSGASVQFTPGVIASLPSDFAGDYLAYLVNGPAYDYTIIRSGFGALPTTNLGNTGNLAFALRDFALPPADDIIQNGHFEGSDLSGWQVSGTQAPTKFTDTRHTGQASAVMKLAAGSVTTPLNPQNPVDYYVIDPEAALDGSGALHVIWGIEEEFATERIYYARRDPSGSWSQPVQIGATTFEGDTEFFPAHIAVEPGGIVHAIWQQVRTPALEDLVVVYSRRALNGTWSDPEVISGATDTTDSTALALDNDGKVHVIWRGFKSGVGMGLFYTQRSTNGAWTPPLEISLTTVMKVEPALAVQADGVVHVVWDEYEIVGGQPTVPHLNYARRDILGIWSVPVLISNNITYSYAARLGLDNSNTLHVSWRGAAGMDIYYTYRSPDGTWQLPQNVSNAPATLSPEHNMVVEPDGDVNLAWYEVNNSEYRDIYYARHTSGGSWSAPEPVSVGANVVFYDEPRISVGTTGNVVIAWVHPSEGVFLAVRSSMGSWDTELGVAKALARVIPVMDAENQLHLIWNHWSELGHTLGKNDPENAALSQTLTIPSNIAHPTLSFFYFLDVGSNGLDKMFSVKLNHGLETHELFTATVDTGGWTHQWVDLGAWSGENVTINFEASSASGLTSFSAALDEVTLGSSFPDLWVEPGLYGEMLAGEQFQAELYYGNQSSVAAEGTFLTLALPPALVFIGADPEPVSIVGNEIVWDTGTLGFDEYPSLITVTLQVASGATFGEEITASYEITGTPTELEMENNTGILLIWVGKHMYLPLVNR